MYVETFFIITTWKRTFKNLLFWESSVWKTRIPTAPHWHLHQSVCGATKIYYIYRKRVRPTNFINWIPRAQAVSPASKSPLCWIRTVSSSSVQLSATGRLLDITYMCYEFRTPLFPAQLLQARQSDLSVTSTPQTVNRWPHNKYSCCSHPLLFVPASHTPVVKVRLVVWRSDRGRVNSVDYRC